MYFNRRKFPAIFYPNQNLDSYYPMLYLKQIRLFVLKSIFHIIAITVIFYDDIFFSFIWINKTL